MNLGHRLLKIDRYRGQVCEVEGITFVNNVKMEFYKLILFVIQLYGNVLYCIYCEKNLCLVISTLHIRSWCIGQESAFLCGHCFRGLYVMLSCCRIGEKTKFPL